MICKNCGKDSLPHLKFDKSNEFYRNDLCKNCKIKELEKEIEKLKETINGSMPPPRNDVTCP